jgi:hypothetical protein
LPSFSTVTCTLTRTSGRTSRTSLPSARRISTIRRSPDIEAITWTTRGSRARAKASISCSSETLSEKAGEEIGSSSP